MLTLPEQITKLRDRIKFLKLKKRKEEEKQKQNQENSLRSLNNSTKIAFSGAPKKKNEILAVFEELEQQKALQLETERRVKLSRRSMDMKSIKEILFKNDETKESVYDSSQEIVREIEKNYKNEFFDKENDRHLANRSFDRVSTQESPKPFETKRLLPPMFFTEKSYSDVISPILNNSARFSTESLKTLYSKSLMKNQLSNPKDLTQLKKTVRDNIKKIL